MIQADFELEADVKRTAEETIQKFNQIDVLVRINHDNNEWKLPSKALAYTGPSDNCKKIR